MDDAVFAVFQPGGTRPPRSFFYHYRAIQPGVADRWPQFDMTPASDLRVLVISPQCDGEDVGETWNAFHWVARLSKICDLTLLTMRRPGRTPPSVQLPGVRVIEWDEFPHFPRYRKMSNSVKPWYPSFYRQARKWISRALREGEKFDLFHQLTPLAMRFPCPGVGFGVPFIVGPLAGSMSNPPGFESECGSVPLYTRLRFLDDFRFRRDPWLRRTYAGAEIVLCSSPYVVDIVAKAGPKRCEVFCEVGIETLGPARAPRQRRPGELKLLHVGRAVRTKGLRDAVRAMAQVSDLPGVTLEVAGGGEELEPCRREAEQLGVSARIQFHGRLPREQIEQLYMDGDVFLFPSFREPTGIVLFEAMRHGLAVITTDRGGPGYIVDKTCGIQISPRTPDQFAGDLAAAIRRMANDADLLNTLSAGARARTEEIGLWENKIDQMMKFYKEAVNRPDSR